MLSLIWNLFFHFYANETHFHKKGWPHFESEGFGHSESGLSGFDDS